MATDYAETSHVFVVRAGEMLTLRDARWGTWYLPGGIVENDETPTEAAIRETFEETGLRIERPELLRDWDFPDVRRPTVRRRYLFVAEAPSARVRLSEEHSDFAWLPPHEYVRRNCSEEMERAIPAFAAFFADARYNCGLLNEWVSTRNQQMIAIKDISANGMTFRCRSAGESGEPVVLLHGFPETSHMWTGLMPKLADAGYRCLAPDQRGYSPGARPDDVESYSYRNLASDVFALADAAGFERFHLIGHDWGALVGWAALGVDATRVASYTSLSIPHALAFARAVYDDPEEEPYRQILGLLLTEGVFETMVQQNDGAGLRAAYTHSPPEQIDEYVSVLSQPGAMKAAASWYRASRAHKRSLEDADAPFGPVTTPSLLIWGKNDAYVRRMSVDLAPEYMQGAYRVVELDAGHWLAQEHPDRVAEEMLAHLRTNKIG